MDKMTLKEALMVLLVDESIEDFVYTVRDRVTEDDPSYRGNRWEHPRVKKFAEAIARLKEEL